MMRIQLEESHAMYTDPKRLKATDPGRLKIIRYGFFTIRLILIQMGARS